MTSLPDRFRVCAAKHIDNVTQPKSESVPGVNAITQERNFCACTVPSNVSRGCKQLSQLSHETCTAVSNRRFRLKIYFPKYNKRRAPAFARLGVMDHLLKLCTGDTRLLLAFLVDEMPLLGNVARAEQQDAFTRQSVASGASGFLIIALQIFRQIIMHNKTHIRFVDAHSERDGGRDHAHVVAQKCILMFCALGASLARRDTASR